MATGYSASVFFSGASSISSSPPAASRSSAAAASSFFCFFDFFASSRAFAAASFSFSFDSFLNCFTLSISKHESTNPHRPLMLLNLRCASGARPVMTTEPSFSSSYGLGSPFNTSTHRCAFNTANIEMRFCACKNLTSNSNEYCVIFRLTLLSKNFLATGSVSTCSGSLSALNAAKSSPYSRMWSAWCVA